MQRLPLFFRTSSSSTSTGRTLNGVKNSSSFDSRAFLPTRSPKHPINTHKQASHLWKSASASASVSLLSTSFPSQSLLHHQQTRGVGGGPGGGGKGKGKGKGPPIVPPVELKFLDIVRSFKEYVWPKDNKEIKARVVLALGLLVGSRLLNIQVPFLFKYAVDQLSIPATTELLFMVPTTLVIGC
jgi:hypothetical protein